MKKYLILLMVLVVSIAGCSSPNAESSDTANNNDTSNNDASNNESSEKDEVEFEDAEEVLDNMLDLVADKEVAYTYVTDYDMDEDDSEVDTFTYDPKEDKFIANLDYTDPSGEHLIIDYTVNSSNEISDLQVTDENGKDVADSYDIEDSDVNNYEDILGYFVNAEIDDAIDSYEEDYEDKDENDTDSEFVLTLPTDDGYDYTYEIAKDSSTYHFTAEGELPMDTTIDFELE